MIRLSSLYALVFVVFAFSLTLLMVSLLNRPCVIVWVAAFRLLLATQKCDVLSVFYEPAKLTSTDFMRFLLFLLCFLCSAIWAITDGALYN